MPAEFSEFAGVFPIIGNIALKFLFPELNITFRGGGIFASFVPVPKTAVNKDDGFILRQNDVRFARKLFDIFAEAVARAVQHGADKNLWLSAFSANAGHIP